MNYDKTKPNYKQITNYSRSKKLTSFWVKHQAARVRRLSSSGLLWLTGGLVEFVVIMRHLVTVTEVIVTEK